MSLFSLFQSAKLESKMIVAVCGVCLRGQRDAITCCCSGAKRISDERLSSSLWSMCTLSGMANNSQMGRSFWLQDNHCFRHSLQSVASCLRST